MGSGEDPILKERIKQVMDMTRRSEDEVVMALHDSDGDLDRAVNDLLEGVKTEWEVKKKKPRQPSGSKQNMDTSGGQDESGDWDERRNQRGGGPPRMRGRANHDNRGCMLKKIEYSILYNTHDIILIILIYIINIFK